MSTLPSKNQAVIRRLSDDLSLMPTKAEAIKFAAMLWAAWPQRGSEDREQADIFSKLMVDLLMGFPKFVCQQLVSVHTGIVGKGGTFRPSVAEVKAFADRLNDKHWRYLNQLKDEDEYARRSFGKDEKFYDRNGRLREGHKFQAPSPEERTTNLEKLGRLSEIIKDTAEATQRANPKPQFVQYDGPLVEQIRMEALENLEAMNDPGESIRKDDD